MNLWIVGIIGGLALLGAAIVREELHRSEMIENGECHIDIADVLYQPASTMVCTAYNGSACMIMTPVTSEPYLRNHFACVDGSAFWWRK